MPLLVLNNIKNMLFGVLFSKTSYICAKRGCILHRWRGRNMFRAPGRMLQAYTSDACGFVQKMKK